MQGRCSRATQLERFRIKRFGDLKPFSETYEAFEGTPQKVQVVPEKSLKLQHHLKFAVKNARITDLHSTVTQFEAKFQTLFLLNFICSSHFSRCKCETIFGFAAFCCFPGHNSSRFFGNSMIERLPRRDSLDPLKKR